MRGCSKLQEELAEDRYGNEATRIKIEGFVV